MISLRDWLRRWMSQPLRPQAPGHPAIAEMLAFVPIEKGVPTPVSLGPAFMQGKLYDNLVYIIIVDSSGLIRTSLKFKPEEAAVLRDSLLQLQLPLSEPRSL